MARCGGRCRTKRPEEVVPRYGDLRIEYSGKNTHMGNMPVLTAGPAMKNGNISSARSQQESESE